MPQMTENELKKQLREKAFARFYLFYGAEKFLVRHYTLSLTQKVLGKGYSDFNYQVINGAAGDIEAIAEAVEALPILAERKCVVVNDLDVEALNAQNTGKLYQLLEDLPETTVLLFTMPTLEFETKRSAKWRKCIAAGQKAGVTVEFSKRGTSALERQLADWAEKLGCSITLINAGKVIQMCGDDLSTLRNELEKLCAYAAGREITVQDIEAVVTKNLETTVFVLSNALLAGEYDRAYRQLDLLFYQREEPVAVLAVLASGYVDMYRVRVAVESGEKSSALTKCFDYKNKEFRLRNAEKNGRRLSSATLRESLDAILEADIRLKSSRTDSRVVMEELIAKLMLIAEKGKVS